MAKNVSSVDLLAPSTATAWAQVGAYSIADMIQHGGTVYFCLVAHTVTDWADATGYVTGDMAVYTDGNQYICISNHTSDLAGGDIPGKATLWTAMDPITTANDTYWEAQRYQAVASGAAAKHYVCGSALSFQAVGTTYGGAGGASVKIEVSNVDTPTVDGDWTTLDTLTLTLGTTATTDTGYTNVPWRWVRANIDTGMTGSGATVSCFMAALT